jgi:hypothetical protein
MHVPYALLVSRKMVLYAFSNGGAFVVEQIQNLAEGGEGWLKDAIAGIVFDSAPAYMHRSMGRKVMKASMPPGVMRTMKLLEYESTRSLASWINRSRKKEFW